MLLANPIFWMYSVFCVTWPSLAEDYNAQLNTEEASVPFVVWRPAVLLISKLPLKYVLVIRMSGNMSLPFTRIISGVRLFAGNVFVVTGRFYSSDLLRKTKKIQNV